MEVLIFELSPSGKNRQLPSGKLVSGSKLQEPPDMISLEKCTRNLLISNYRH